MRLLPELLRLLGLRALEDEPPEERARRERFEEVEALHRHALAHAEQVLADVRRAERLIAEHRW